MKKSLAKNAVFNVIYKVLNVIFPLISVAYIARILLPEGVGKISYAQNIVSYFTLIAALGIPVYGVREISKCRDNQEKTNKTFSELLIINFFSTTICAIIYYAVIIIEMPDNFELYAVCGFVILFNYINIDWFYQGREEYVYIAVRSVIIKCISVIMLFIFVRTQNDYIIYALITCIAAGGNHFFNILNARKFVKFTFKNLSLKKHMKPIWTLVICTIATELYSKVDITMIGAMYNDTNVGYYSNSQKLASVVLTLTTAISAIFLPRISYYFANDKEKYNNMVLFGFKIALFFSLPCCLGIALVSDDLVPVMFGELFMPASSTIKILSCLVFIKSIGDILCYQVIISSGNEKKLIWSYITAALVNIILNFLLIPAYQQNGAAVASVISELIVNCTLLPFTLKIIHLKISRRYILSVAVSSVVMSVCVIAVGYFVKNCFAALFLEVGAGILSYFIVNILMKNEILESVLNKLKKKQ